MAEALKLEVEVKLSRERFASVYVYYKNGDQEPIPLYRSKTEKEPNVEQVTSILRNMIYVLSFHPKQSALRQMRSEIIHFS